MCIILINKYYWQYLALRSSDNIDKEHKPTVSIPAWAYGYQAFLLPSFLIIRISKTETDWLLFLSRYIIFTIEF